MAILADLERRAEPEHLEVLGALNVTAEDGVGHSGTLCLLGPHEPGFWSHVTAAPEFAEGAPDPMDRWSSRVIGSIAQDVGGEALFPFGDPVRPFVSWALRSGRVWISPVGLLIHDTAGLMVSFRGAVLVPGHVDQPAPRVSPCETCRHKPCLTACPVGALDAEGYKLDKCHRYLDSEDGQACMDGGCLVRRTCPVSRGYGRDPRQSAYHMRQFH